MEDRCVMCGEIIPEGRMVCPVCEKRVLTRKGEQTMKARTIRENMGADRGDPGSR